VGTVYRRHVRFCLTCDRRLDTTAVRKACEGAGHVVEIRQQPIWWIQYHIGGRPQYVSSESERKSDAVDMLKDREGKVVNGAPITAKVGKLRFEEAATDLLNDYRVNGRRSLRTIEHRVEHHLKPFLGGRRMSAIGTADIRAYVARRQTAEASNGSINRELTALKRMFSAGFFEPAQRRHLIHLGPRIEIDASQAIFVV
jgi:Phage integrase, N-terminal SAM-like domain